ncbi:MAG: thioesterase family protein [Chitinophagales bacterium]
MKNPFQTGDEKIYSKEVKANEIAEFESGTVHQFYATFALAKDAEWSTRLFVLEMKEEGEEGIGTFIEVTHHAPAMIGEVVDFYAKLEEVNGHEVICSFEARVGERKIASGKTGQKILKKEKVERLFHEISKPEKS